MRSKNLIYSRLEQDLTLMKVKMTLSLAPHNLRGRPLELLKLPWLKYPKVNHCLLFWPSLDQTIPIPLICSPRMMSFKIQFWVKFYIFLCKLQIYKCKWCAKCTEISENIFHTFKMMFTENLWMKMAKIGYNRCKSK